MCASLPYWKGSISLWLHMQLSSFSCYYVSIDFPHVSMPFNPQTKLMSQLSNPLPGICRFSLVMGATWFVKLTGFHSHDEGFNGFRLCDNASDESWCHHVLWSFVFWSYLIMFVHPAASGSPPKKLEYHCSDYRLQHRRWGGPWETWSAIVWEVRTNETIRRRCRPRRNGKHRE